MWSGGDNNTSPLTSLGGRMSGYYPVDPSVEFARAVLSSPLACRSNRVDSLGKQQEPQTPPPVSENTQPPLPTFPNTTPMEEREYLRNIPYDEYADRRIENYSNQFLGGCIHGLNEQNFRFYMDGVLNGRICNDYYYVWFLDYIPYHQAEYCLSSAWSVHNPDNSPIVCANNIYYTDGLTGLQNDDNNKIWLVIKMLEKHWVREEILGMAWWESDVVHASQFFAETVRLLQEYPDVHEDWLELFKTVFTRDFSPDAARQEALNNILKECGASLAATFTKRGLTLESATEAITEILLNAAPQIAMLFLNAPDKRDLVEQELFFELAAAGVRRTYDIDELEFNYIWRTISNETKSSPCNDNRWNNPSICNDWVTPLIHAGSLYFQMVEVYRTQGDRLIAKLDSNDWEVIEDEEGVLFIVQHDNIDSQTGEPFTISLFDYANDFIWRKQGEEHETIRTALLEEINQAVIASRERCYNCTEEHYWARELLKYIGYMNDGIGFDIHPDIHIDGELRRRAREVARITAEDCCNMHPPRLYNEEEEQCVMNQTAYEACYPRVFRQDDCGCSALPGSVICRDREPPNTQIFALNQQTGVYECVPCEEPTPITQDGLNCIRRPQVTRRPPPRPITPTPPTPTVEPPQPQPGIPIGISNPYGK